MFTARLLWAALCHVYHWLRCVVQLSPGGHLHHWILQVGEDSLHFTSIQLQVNTKKKKTPLTETETAGGGPLLCPSSHTILYPVNVSCWKTTRFESWQLLYALFKFSRGFWKVYKLLGTAVFIVTLGPFCDSCFFFQLVYLCPDYLAVLQMWDYVLYCTTMSLVLGDTVGPKIWSQLKWKSNCGQFFNTNIDILKNKVS